MTLSDENETNLEVILTEYDSSVELLYSWIKYISESDSFRNFNTVIELNWIELNNHTIVCFWISIMFKKYIIRYFPFCYCEAALKQLRDVLRTVCTIRVTWWIFLKEKIMKMKHINL